MIDPTDPLARIPVRLQIRRRGHVADLEAHVFEERAPFVERADADVEHVDHGLLAEPHTDARHRDR